MRRTVIDPLEPTKEPRWYVVRNMHRGVLEAHELPAGADLKRVFVQATLDAINAGWKLGEFSSRTGIFSCTRGVERLSVEILPTDHGPAPMHLIGYTRHRPTGVGGRPR